MTNPIPTSTLEKFTAFGDLLRFLRRRVGITQVDLSLAVGYSNAQISRLEQNLRPPDMPTIEARFVPALALEDEPKAVARLLELAANVRREDAPSVGLCPYKGLSYFDEGDADLFVGRETLTSKLVERVLALGTGAAPEDLRFLAIVGASGSGKSSLARAGLVPALRWNQTSAGWPIHVFTPAAHPIESLAASLVDEGGSVAATTTLMDDLMRDARSLHLFIRRALRAAGASRMLLVIDQFEEVFTLCRSEAERAAFINNLMAAGSDLDGSTVVVITLRADFYSYCAGYAELRQALAHHQEYIGSMSDAELRRAIEEPARRGRWEFEPGLVDLLIQDVGHEPGALPLLSHALLETWERRRGHSLTHSGYASAGGVRGAIAETAEAVYTDQFTEQQRVIARRVFLRLTELGDEAGAGDTRRRVRFEELILKPREADATRAVLRALADARLITVNQDSVEVAHEALIREWPTLRGWLEENREGLRLHRQLSETAQEWAALNREPDMLYRGARLSQARDWAAANSDEMNALEREFLAASVEGAEREAAERETQRQRELETAQKLAEAERARAEAQTQAATRLRARSRVISGVGGVALGLALLAGLFAIQSTRNAQQAGKNLTVAQANFARAESLRLAAEANVLLAEGGDPQTAALLSIRALQSNYSPQADAALSASLASLYNREIFRGHTGWIYSVAVSPDGKYALTGSQDGTARLWDKQSGKELRQFVGHKGGVSSAAFSPDGKYVVTGGNDQTVRIWDANTGTQLRVLAGQSGGITSVSFSPDGREVLSASDQAAQLWDAASGQPIRTFAGHTGLVSQAVFSADGRYVLTGSYDNTARLWDAATGQVLQTFSGPDAGFFNRHVTSVVLSPDGNYALSGSDDRTAQLWGVASGQRICTFSGHTGAVNAVAFSPDGKYVATASDDKTVKVWLASTCQEVRHYAGFDAGVKSVAFSPDGRYILTGAEDNTARLLAAPASDPLRTFVSHGPALMSFTYSPAYQYMSTPGGINSVAFSPDGESVLTGGLDRQAHLWDAVTGALLRDFIGHTGSVNSVAFSPDGRYVLTGSSDHTARLWDVQTGQELRAITANIAGVDTAVFSPDDKYLMTAGLGGFGSSGTGGSGAYVNGVYSVVQGAKLWDAASGQEVRAYNFGPYIDSTDMSTVAAISPDGKRGLVLDGFEVILFDIGSGKLVCDLVGHLSYATSVAFSPDGKYMLTGSEDQNARLWDAKTCQLIRLFTDHASRVTSVAFSPDSKYILTGHDDNKARLWDAATGQELREFTGHTLWIRSVAFSPDGRYVLTGSADGTARIWDTDYHDSIRYACSLLWRDLTQLERTQFSIADTTPTCPQP